MEMTLPSGIERPGQNEPGEPAEPKPDDPAAKVKVRVKTRHGEDGRGAIVYPIEVEGLSIHPKLVNNLKELEAYLTEQNARAALDATEPAKPTSVKIEADRKVKWVFVVEVMDACKRAGCQVGFSPPPD